MAALMSETISKIRGMTPPLSCRCGTCQKCRDRVRHRELRHGVERNRTCAATGCDKAFYAHRANTYYCSAACRNREAQRRFRKTEKAQQYKRQWAAENPDRQAGYHAHWYASGGKEVRAAYKTDKVKAHAHAQVMVATRNGSLLRQPCEICGALRVDAHHPDYGEPLDVRWLCRQHHAAVHAGEVVLSQRQ